uniref:B30.2/SPRY domain-containing protein n=1 Tax=Esox lucius TaxID=8010 RepID=A0AAY5KL85_ESOLU
LPIPKQTDTQRARGKDKRDRHRPTHTQIKGVRLSLMLFFILLDSCQLTLDPNTAYQNLCLSEGNRKVTCSNEVQSYPDHPDRFTFHNQVLCREGLSGVCYWEVEWSGGGVGVAVSYKEISRKGNGNKCLFGHNDQSWMLFCSTSRCYFYHNTNRTDIHVPCSSRVGVYLDHRAGTLSFYSVSDTMTLLHRVQTTFTQPLYPGFYVHYGRSVKILTPI